MRRRDFIKTGLLWLPSVAMGQVYLPHRRKAFLSSVVKPLISEIGNAKANGTGTALSVTHGLTLVSGDVVLAFAAANGAITTPTLSDNNGATPFTIPMTETLGKGSGSGDTGSYLIGYRICTSEPAAYNFTTSESNLWSLHVRQFRYVHSDVFDVAPSASTRTIYSSAGTTATSSDLVTLTNNTVGIVWIGTDSTSVTYSGVTNSYGNEVEPTLGFPSASYTRALPTAGTVGTVAVTLSSSNDWTTHHFSLKQA